MRLYYQINYALTDVPADAACFHAQFRRVPKLPAKSVYTILDGVKGQGHYVGTYLAWEVRSPGWWGEGEIKFFLDGDQEFPTICGTGTEDYFCGSYNFENRQTKLYQPFSTPYTGLAQVLPPEMAYRVGQRFGLYRWHIPDPVRFQKDLRVTIQALGWQPGGRYLPLEDDIASVAYWYQSEPHAQFPRSTRQGWPADLAANGSDPQSLVPSAGAMPARIAAKVDHASTGTSLDNEASKSMLAGSFRSPSKHGTRAVVTAARGRCPSRCSIPGLRRPAERSRSGGWWPRLRWPNRTEPTSPAPSRGGWREACRPRSRRHRRCGPGR